MSASLSGKVAVVTGAARGLGREIAQALAESGADIVVGDIQEEAGSLAASELAELGRRSVYIRTDVTQVADCRNLISESVRRLGGLHILVNNAGITPMVSIPDTTEEVWDRVQNINQKGVFFCSQAAAAIFKEQRRRAHHKHFFDWRPHRHTDRGGALCSLQGCSDEHDQVVRYASRSIRRHGECGSAVSDANRPHQGLG